jgi:hypothetical protein
LRVLPRQIGKALKVWQGRGLLDPGNSEFFAR